MGRKREPLQIVERVHITQAGAKGVSVGKAADGKIIFVQNVVPGDVVDVRVHKKKKNYLEGKAVAFHEYSLERVEPKCAHFGVCGGCKWQHWDYEKQLAYKQDEVYNQLKRIGKVELPEIETIAGCKDIFFYRNKMEFGFSKSRWLTPEEIATGAAIEDEPAVGFHIPRVWDKILDIQKCWLQPDPSNAIRNFIRDYAKANGLTFFDPKHHGGLLRTLMIRTTSIGEVMVLIQFFDNVEKERNQLLKALLEEFPSITSLLYVINQKANDTIYDQTVQVFHGRAHIYEEMEGLKFKIQAKSFYQTNSAQAYELYKITREFAGLTGHEVVYDLYTGTGTIAQFVASKAKKVIGVEAVADAIADAKENAQLNNIDNCSFFVGDMKNIFSEAFVEQHGKPDVVITDPPRDGMHADVVAQLLLQEPRKIVYVSCNAATQARDLALLDEKYKVVRVRPVDMFPQTHHVENVVLLELK